MTDTTLCVFAKPPRPGAVKTRLVPPLEATQAAALAAAFLVDTWTTVASVAGARAILATTAPDGLPVDAPVWLQGEGDLGTRIERILSRALAETPSAVALGADSPGLPVERLEAARHALRDHDAVLGPCADGGFYLLGVRACPPGLLAGVPWSDPATCERTLAALAARGWRTAMLAPWFDVDGPADLAMLEDLLARGAIHAPATSGVLAAIRSAAGAASCR